MPNRFSKKILFQLFEKQAIEHIFDLKNEISALLRSRFFVHAPYLMMPPPLSCFQAV